MDEWGVALEQSADVLSENEVWLRDERGRGAGADFTGAGTPSWQRGADPPAGVFRERWSPSA